MTRLFDRMLDLGAGRLRGAGPPASSPFSAAMPGTGLVEVVEEVAAARPRTAREPASGVRTVAIERPPPFADSRAAPPLGAPTAPARPAPLERAPVAVAFSEPSSMLAPSPRTIEVPLVERRSEAPHVEHHFVTTLERSATTEFAQREPPTAPVSPASRPLGPRPVATEVLRPRTVAAENPAGEVEINIGRIEIRTTRPPPPRPRAPVQMSRPRMSLSDFLSRRRSS